MKRAAGVAVIVVPKSVDRGVVSSHPDSLTMRLVLPTVLLTLTAAASAGDVRLSLMSISITFQGPRGRSSVGDLLKRNSDKIYKILKLATGDTSATTSKVPLGDYESFAECQNWWKKMR